MSKTFDLKEVAEHKSGTCLPCCGYAVRRRSALIFVCVLRVLISGLGVDCD